MHDGSTGPQLSGFAPKSLPGLWCTACDEGHSVRLEYDTEKIFYWYYCGEAGRIVIAEGDVETAAWCGILSSAEARLEREKERTARALGALRNIANFPHDMAPIRCAGWMADIARDALHALGADNAG